jgi:hypothetical protein
MPEPADRKFMLGLSLTSLLRVAVTCLDPTVDTQRDEDLKGAFHPRSVLYLIRHSNACSPPLNFALPQVRMTEVQDKALKHVLDDCKQMHPTSVNTRSIRSWHYHAFIKEVLRRPSRCIPRDQTNQPPNVATIKVKATAKYTQSGESVCSPVI